MPLSIVADEKSDAVFYFTHPLKDSSQIGLILRYVQKRTPEWGNPVFLLWWTLVFFQYIKVFYWPSFIATFKIEVLSKN